MSDSQPNPSNPDPGSRASRDRAPAPATAMPIVLPASASEAGRNLVLGVVLALVALPVAGLAFLWAPQESFVAISTALLISLLVFLFFQLRWVAQRNGLFALLCAGLLVTLAVPILVKIAASSSEWAEWVVSFKQAQDTNSLAGVGERGKSAPKGPRNADKAGPAESGDRPSARGSSLPVKPTEAAVSSPAEAESRIVSGSGTSAPAPSALPGSGSEKSASASRTPSGSPEETVSERVTRQAKEEAIRRYPKLAEVGSPEHSRYIQTFNEYRRLYKYDFFAEPNWPLNLAELLAKSDGWKRADSADVASAQPPSNAQSASMREEAIVRAEKSGPVPFSPDSGIVPSPEAAASGDASNAGKLFGLDLPDTDPANPNSRAVVEALEEVRRRYPPMAQVGSVENRVFVESVQEYERLRPEFFETPRWPVRLADLVAKRMGWKKMEASGSSAGER